MEEWIVKCCFSDAVGEGMATAATFAVIPGGGAPAFRAGEETAETVVVGIFLAGEAEEEEVVVVTSSTMARGKGCSTYDPESKTLWL